MIWLAFGCRPPPAQQFAPPRDVSHVDLAVDLATRRATARLQLAAGAAGVVLSAEDLTIDAVRGPDGPLRYWVDVRRLYVAAPAGAVEVRVDYRFAAQERSTFAWPDRCGRWFPCDPDPADGLTFTLDVRGGPAVFPRRVDTEAPPYMIAWARGAYERIELGRTPAGTRVALWTEPAHRARALAGAERLPELFGWLEQTYGPYAFGDEVGSVVVEWADERFGGMEHHPYWHVAATAVDDPVVHAHEAAHGWFGDGVRIACWEDFVLSEGTTSYLEVRAMEAVYGPAKAAERWADIESLVPEGRSDVWRDGCGRIDPSTLADLGPYVRGPLFFRDVASHVGVDVLDRALRDFYLRRRGTSARFADLLASIQQDTGFDARPLAEAWLRAR